MEIKSLKKLSLILHSKFLYFFLTVVIFLACIFTFCFPKTSKLDPTATKFTGKVIDFQVEGDLLKITLQSVEKLVGNYYFSTLEEKNNFLNDYHLGDEMIVTGVLERPKKSTVPNLFDYQKYLERKKIFYLIKIDTITKIKDNDSFFYSVKNFLIKRIENFQKKEYFYAFFGPFVLWAAKLREYIRDNNLIEQFNDLDAEKEGVIVKCYGKKLLFERVSGADRPELKCFTSSGDIWSKRPYIDEIQDL